MKTRILFSASDQFNEQLAHTYTSSEQVDAHVAAVADNHTDAKSHRIALAHQRDRHVTQINPEETLAASVLFFRFVGWCT
jgi:hypothetical protein